ncbi:MAG: response regulator [Flavobacterium sp.]|nr:response regulator [Flavobacterium sp.]
MKKIVALNTYFKLLLLIIGTSILFLLLYLSLYAYTMQQEKEVYKTTYNQYNSEVSSLFELNSKTHIATIKDVTYWSELVKFISTKNQEWFDNFIVTEFETYEVDYIGIYGLDEQLVNKVSSNNLKTRDFIPKGVFKELYKSKLTSFYIRIPEGIVEVFGATIHPSDDPKKVKTLPAGYFFMARLINKPFIQNLDRISNSQTTLIDAKAVPSDDIESVIIYRKLKDWRNEDVAQLAFKRAFNLDFRSTKKILSIIIIAFIINIVVYLYFSKRWVYAPLKVITKVLETGTQEAIDQLKHEPGEFGYIGNLFEENNNQRKQLEISKRKAEESDNLKSSFLANLSHEIRTPMNAIIGFSDLLNDKKLSETDKIEYIKIIRNSGSNLVSIIEDLIEMSKIDAQQITPKMVGFDINSCCQELYEAIRVTIPKEKKIVFNYLKNSTPVPKHVISDKTKLRQIITNLITNAIKYTEKGTVEFGFQIDEKTGSILFHVKDSGVGIDEKNLKVIFDRFRRVEDDFSVELSGLGLGLAISKAYVEMLGGTISVQSKVGEGSVFQFSIPLQYDTTKVEEVLVESAIDFEANHDKVILVAEDDNINFLLLKKILQLRNYTIIRAVNGQEAVTICATNAAINLVFMDIKMPIMDGYAAFEKIKMFLPNLPVIAQTAHSSIEDKERVLSAGFTDYITKPLDKEKIFQVIDGVLK